MNEELIPKRKVVYAEIDDEVTDIYEKVRDAQIKHVYIVIPKRAIFFQSVVNFKILKRKISDSGKTVAIITNDKNGIHLAQQAGMEVYNKENDEGRPVLFATETDDEKLRITPLRASINAVIDQQPTRLQERKLSISEILKKKRGDKALNISKVAAEPKKKKERRKFVLVAPNRHALIGLTVFVVFILLVVVYIALPGATIYLTPSASVLEKSVNITLADYQKNISELELRPPHEIASYPIDTTITKTITHYSTGKKFSDKAVNASGRITIVNTTNSAWPLVPSTRFQTKEGVVFRITSAINVPAASATGQGKVETYVVADPVDAYGAIVGEKGNIEPTRFFLPGLKQSSQSKLYAESTAPMTGGVTDFVAFVSAEDLVAAKARLNDELLKNAIIELRLAVVEKSKLVGDESTYILLEGDGASKIGDVKIDLPSNIEGQTLSEFNVSGSVHVSGVYYDHAEMLNILKTELLLKKSPQKDLLKISEDSTSYRIFEWDEAHGKIKLTANIKGIEQFSIDPTKENGARLLKKIKDHIAGKDIETAKAFIQNLPEINKVEIDTWPAWAPTIPNITDNIKFDIRGGSSLLTN